MLRSRLSTSDRSSLSERPLGVRQVDHSVLMSFGGARFFQSWTGRGAATFWPWGFGMRVVVLGAGSWGTTVASLVARRHPTTLWARDPDVALELDRDKRNSRYLSEHRVPESMRATADLEQAVCRADLLVVGVPSVARARHARSGQAVRPTADPDHQPHQGLRGRHAAPDDAGDRGRAPVPPDGGADRPEHRPRDRRRACRGDCHRDQARGRRPRAPTGAAIRAAARLHEPRRGRLRDRWRAQERGRDRLRDRPRPRRRRQHSRCRHDPGLVRADPAGRGDGG